MKYTLRGACLMLDSQEVYSRERKLRATFKNHLNSAHLQKVSNTLLQDLVKLPTLQPAYTVKGSLKSAKITFYHLNHKTSALQGGCKRGFL